ncbi:MAG: TRAP transporter large permease [Desulfovibrionaceae bacterium]|nr:TRAP transporter large permease [Desulfovibrionaceae bacterium]
MESFSDPSLWLLFFFLLPLLFRVPIAVALGMAAVIVIWKWDKGLAMLSYNFFAGIAKPPLLAIPFFIIAGFIMERAGIAKSIINFVQAITGGVTGGLAVVAVAVATFWGAVSGSGPATVAALGLILIPGMAKAGYAKDFSAATVSVASGLAIVIPPSIAFIVYGGIANVSVPALFAAGILPGLLVAGFLMVTVFVISRSCNYRGEKSTIGIGRAFREAFFGLLTPVVILGGIYGGIVTPTEAAAVAVFYGLFVGVFINRQIRTIQDFFYILCSSVRSTAVVMIVVTCAGLFSWVATDIGLIEKSSKALLALSDNEWLILIMINFLLLLAGMLLDAISIYYVFLPFLLPILAHFAWDPIWFGVMMTVNLAVGQVTPPVAVNLYVGANISKISMEAISRAALPFILAALLALAVIIVFPSLSTFLPTILGL